MVRAGQGLLWKLLTVKKKAHLVYLENEMGVLQKTAFYRSFSRALHGKSRSVWFCFRI